MFSSQQTKGAAALVLLAFGFGMIAITARYLSFYYTLFQQLYLSIGVAFIMSLFLFPRTLQKKRILGIPRRDWGIMLFRVIIGYLFGASLYRESLTLTKISNVTFIQSIPFAGIFGFLLFKEKFTIWKALLLTVAYIGVLIIAVKDYSSLLIFGKGELFSLISSALFSFSYISRKWQTDYLNDKEITQILLFIGTVVLFAASLLNGEGIPILNWELTLFLSVFFTGFFNAVNLFLINYGFKNVKLVLASNILTLESIFALVLAFIFYRELPSVKELFGGALIVGSVIQMNRLET
jgi:drug/metabolite transporter (DMT)-like permease